VVGHGTLSLVRKFGESHCIAVRDYSINAVVAVLVLDVEHLQSEVFLFHIYLHIGSSAPGSIPQLVGNTPRFCSY